MSYTRNFTPCCLILGFTLCVPFIAQSGAINVNGTCELGNCASVDSLSDGTSTSGSFDFTYTFGNGDAYDISGVYGASYSSISGSTISVEPNFTYIGIAPSVGTDTINFALFQDFFDASPGSWAGTYSEDIQLDLGGTAGPGSTISGQFFYDGQGVGLVGPFGPGSYSVSQSAALDFGPLDTNDTLSGEFDFSAQFAAGTLPGAGADAVATPEPAMALPCGLALILFISGVRKYGVSNWNRSRLAV